MAIELAPPPNAAPALLVEPIALPGRRMKRDSDSGAWLHRTAERDAQGAIAQRIVLCRNLLGWSRKQLAREYGYSERQISTVLRLHGGWAEYTAPVFDLLTRAGIIRRGRTRQLNATTYRDQLRAQQRLMREALRLLMHGGSAETRQRVLTELWLLSGAWADAEILGRPR